MDDLACRFAFCVVGRDTFGRCHFARAEFV